MWRPACRRAPSTVSRVTRSASIVSAPVSTAVCASCTAAARRSAHSQQSLPLRRAYTTTAILRSQQHSNDQGSHDASSCAVRRAPTPAPDAGWAEPLPPLRERVREREPMREATPEQRAADLATLSPAELKQIQDEEMDRATRKARRDAAKRRRTQTRRQHDPQPYVPPPPLYHPAPFATLPVIPSPAETIQSAMIRVDKVPKSSGFGKEISRVRGQMAKYNFIARRQLEVAHHELAVKLQERLDAFPRIPRGSLKTRLELQKEEEALLTPPDPNEPIKPELHPFDHALLVCTMDGANGAAEYNALLNHTQNLINKLRSTYRQGVQALNHSKSIWESREVHKKAIYRMKDLWQSGLTPEGSNGGAGQKSATELVERLRELSKKLRYLPTIEFRRNLLDARGDVASYLSLLPQEMFLLPESELTFARLRSYLPPSPTYTFTLFGAPNVGKSSLLASLSRAKVEVAPFAFTTRTLQMGHLERAEEQSPGWERHANGKRATSKQDDNQFPSPEYTPAVPLTRVQLLDTPGLLFRPDSMRKPVEQLALAVTQHVNPVIIGFVLDGTGTCGTTVRMQQYLRREMRQRFHTFQPPHTRASETDAGNRLSRDPLYANVDADPLFQRFARRMQAIPWIDIASKFDVRKKEFVSEAIIEAGESRDYQNVHLVEREIADALETAAAADAKEASAGDVNEELSINTSLVASTTDDAASTPQSRLDRAAWKLREIRAHMHRYLCDADGRIRIDDEMDASLHRALPASTSSSSKSASVLPGAIAISSETGKGLASLEARIWHEVDARESLRLEFAFREMKARILWMRQGATGFETLESSSASPFTPAQVLPFEQHRTAQLEE